MALLSGSHPLCISTCCYRFWAAAVQRPSRQHGEERWSLHHLVIKDLGGAHIRSQASLPPYDRNLAKYHVSIAHSPLETMCGVVGMSYICISGLLKFILYGADRLIFIENKSDQATPSLFHCT